LTVGVAVVGKVGTPHGTALEFGVLGVDARVDDVGAGALSSSVFEGVSSAAGLGAGNARKAPWSVLLGGGDGDDAILLNVFNLAENVSDTLGCLGRQRLLTLGS
jgi:hypothetical protein